MTKLIINNHPNINFYLDALASAKIIVFWHNSCGKIAQKIFKNIEEKIPQFNNLFHAIYE